MSAVQQLRDRLLQKQAADAPNVDDAIRRLMAQQVAADEKAQADQAAAAEKAQAEQAAAQKQESAARERASAFDAKMQEDTEALLLSYFDNKRRAQQARESLEVARQQRKELSGSLYNANQAVDKLTSEFRDINAAIKSGKVADIPETLARLNALRAELPAAQTQAADLKTQLSGIVRQEASSLKRMQAAQNQLETVVAESSVSEEDLNRMADEFRLSATVAATPEQRARRTAAGIATEGDRKAEYAASGLGAKHREAAEGIKDKAVAATNAFMQYGKQKGMEALPKPALENADDAPTAAKPIADSTKADLPEPGVGPVDVDATVDAESLAKSTAQSQSRASSTTSTSPEPSADPRSSSWLDRATNAAKPHLTMRNAGIGAGVLGAGALLYYALKGRGDKKKKKPTDNVIAGPGSQTKAASASVVLHRALVKRVTQR